ncbi:MAG: hypothetical protein ACI97B_002372, partial [Verrucomicrobiales bacterium]
WQYLRHSIFPGDDKTGVHRVNMETRHFIEYSR